MRGLAQPKAVQVESDDESRLEGGRPDRNGHHGLHREKKKRSEEEQDDGQPEEEDVVALRFGDGLRRDLEQRGSADRHGDADAARQGPDRIAVAQAEQRVHAVEGAGFQFVDHFKPHDDGRFAFPDGTGQIPFGTVIDVGQGGRERGERRNGVAAAVAEPLDEGAGADVVVAQRELVRPGLERILPVPVHDHVLRQVFQPKPGGGVGFQGLGGIAVQQRQAALHPLAQFPGGGLGVRMGLVRQERGHEEHQGDGKDRHPRPKPYAVGSTHGDRALPAGW